MIEILIFDNFSQDGTADYVKSLAVEYSFIQYFKHHEFRNSAEESTFHAVEKATGEYIWTFGDDDIPTITAIPKILIELQNESPALLLLNLNFKGFSKTKQLLPIQKNIVYEQGVDFFKIGGFTGWLIACISSIVLKKEYYDIKLFNQILNISAIYSHPILMFCKVLKEKIVILAEPLFIYKANAEEAELKNIGGLTIKNNKLKLFSWHLGLIKLITFASNYSGISIKDMINFEELTHNKEDGSYRKLKLLDFILHHIKVELENKNDKQYFEANRENYNNFKIKVIDFLNAIKHDSEVLKNQ